MEKNIESVGYDQEREGEHRGPAQPPSSGVRFLIARLNRACYPHSQSPPQATPQYSPGTPSLLHFSSAKELFDVEPFRETVSPVTAAAVVVIVRASARAEKFPPGPTASSDEENPILQDPLLVFSVPVLRQPVHCLIPRPQGGRSWGDPLPLGSRRNVSQLWSRRRRIVHVIREREP